MDSDYICSITIRFGPYEAHGFIRHRPLKLQGILSELSKKGIEVELFPTKYLNELSVEMKGAIIFRCDIRGLKFHMEIDDEDVVGKRLIDTVSEAYNHFNNSRNVNRFAIIESRMFDPLHERASRVTSLMQILFKPIQPPKRRFN